MKEKNGGRVTEEKRGSGKEYIRSAMMEKEGKRK